MLIYCQFVIDSHLDFLSGFFNFFFSFFICMGVGIKLSSFREVLLGRVIPFVASWV